MLLDITLNWMSNYLKRATPDEWLYTVCDLNYDDENEELLYWIIRQPQCEKAVALALYWRLNPGYYAQYEYRDSIKSAHEKVTFDLLKEVETKYQDGFYKNTTLGFDPAKDFVVDGAQDYAYDWTKVYEGNQLKRKLPDLMKVKIVGSDVNRDKFKGWIDGMPPVVWDKFNKCADSMPRIMTHVLLAATFNKVVKIFGAQASVASISKRRVCK